jgi:hypothetical protein
MHPLFYDRGWTFDGNLDKPTFTPSFKHTGGRGPTWVCHYVLMVGVLTFQDDCSHALKKREVPLPDLPARLRDWDDGNPAPAASDSCPYRTSHLT